MGLAARNLGSTPAGGKISKSPSVQSSSGIIPVCIFLVKGIIFPLTALFHMQPILRMRGAILTLPHTQLVRGG